jgi:hypothetical protein
MRNVVIALGVLALMVISFVATFAGAVWGLMTLGLRRHGNYEYYGLTSAIYLVYIAAAVGFFAPGVAAWYLYMRPGKSLPWQFSVRTLLTVVTLLAVLLGTASYLRLW